MVGAVLCLVFGCTKQPDAPPETSVEPTAAAAPETGKPAAGEEISGELTIFIAASLTRCCDSMAQAFEAVHPGVKVSRESGGSRDQCRKVTQLQREADLIATADYELIDEMLGPEYALPGIAFARYRVVIAYSD